MTEPTRATSLGTFTDIQGALLLVFLEAEEARLPPPSHQDIMRHFGWRSTGTARDHIKACAKRSGLEHAGPAGAARSWTLTDLGRSIAKRVRARG